MDFWTRLDILLTTHRLVIDRPTGSTHPRFPQLVYPLDYGYLEGTSGGDGNELDVWRGTLDGKQLVAIACTVDSKKKDAEIKLLVGCTEEEIGVIGRFHNENQYMSGIVIERRKSEHESASVVPDSEAKTSPPIEPSPAFGMWKDREDMADPSAYVRRLRTGKVDGRNA